MSSQWTEEREVGGWMINRAKLIIAVRGLRGYSCERFRAEWVSTPAPAAAGAGWLLLVGYLVGEGMAPHSGTTTQPHLEWGGGGGADAG